MKENLKIFLSVAALVLSIWSIMISINIKHESEKFFLAEKRPYVEMEIEKSSDGSFLHISRVNDGPFSGGIQAPITVKLSNAGGLAARDIKLHFYFFNEAHQNEFTPYAEAEINMPDTQKLLPGKDLITEITIQNSSPDSIEYKEIMSGKLRVQVVAEYKSDIDKNEVYRTTNQFSITSKEVKFIGTVGTLD